jgi:peptidoglycan/xylan/chitin deacetylase (PgdA/CDA1 family)
VTIIKKTFVFIKKRLKRHIPEFVVIQKLPKKLANNVLLTFDDGPCSINTPNVLKVLDEYNVKALFFVVGKRAQEHGDLLELISGKGHLLCNHTYSHEYYSLLSPISLFKEIFLCQSLIRKNSRQNYKIFRPPNGRISLLGLMIAKMLKMKVVLWSLAGDDWKRGTQSEAALIGCEMAKKLRRGDVVLLHDDNPNVCIILRKILEKIKNENYSTAEAFEYCKTLKFK